MSPQAPLSVAVVGAAGRMGRFACELFDARPDFELVARIGRDELAPDALRGADVGVDLTRAGLGAEHGRAMLEAGLAIVIGTSGVTPDEVRGLDGLARELGLGGLVVPNFSLGAWLLERAAALVAPYLDAAEIVEEHHPAKRDAPSGTARHLASVLGAARERAGRPAAEVPIHSLRMDGVLANHEVRFGAPGETLALRHVTLGREAFAPGLVLAVRCAAGARGVAVGLGDALAAGGPVPGRGRW